MAPRARSDRRAVAPPNHADTSTSAVTVDLVGAPPNRPGAERLAALRERWAQATFFLFDANSWR